MINIAYTFHTFYKAGYLVQALVTHPDEKKDILLDLSNRLKVWAIIQIVILMIANIFIAYHFNSIFF